jgi:MFS family permease
VYIGRILGLAVSGYCTDKFGRRPTIFIGSAITIVGIIIQAAAQNIAMFVVGRAILGAYLELRLVN